MLLSTSRVVLGVGVSWRKDGEKVRCGIFMQSGNSNMWEIRISEPRGKRKRGSVTPMRWSFCVEIVAPAEVAYLSLANLREYEELHIFEWSSLFVVVSCLLQTKTTWRVPGCSGKMGILAESCLQLSL